MKRYSVVETGRGKIVAFGDYRHTPDMLHPRKFWIRVNVDSAWQRKGIGRVLYERVMRDMAEMSAITLRVQEFDFGKFPGYIEKMAGQGITISRYEKCPIRTRSAIRSSTIS